MQENNSNVQPYEMHHERCIIADPWQNLPTIYLKCLSFLGEFTRPMKLFINKLMPYTQIPWSWGIKQGGSIYVIIYHIIFIIRLKMFNTTVRKNVIEMRIMLYVTWIPFCQAILLFSQTMV